eukprot:5254-Chlamydomonas_euryale.AAC.1
MLERLSEFKVRSAIIFTATCKGCHQLSCVLEHLGLPCVALHSGRPQKQRLAALAQFKASAGWGVAGLSGTEHPRSRCMLRADIVSAVSRMSLPLMLPHVVRRASWCQSFSQQTSPAVASTSRQLTW